MQTRSICFALFIITFIQEALFASPAYVDLRAQQTPIRSQHGNNCFIYATVAALEARLKREGHGELDLSEAFSDYMGPLFFLETCEMDGRFRTTRMRVPPAGERETSLAVDRQPTVESATPCQRIRIPPEHAFPAMNIPVVGPADSTDASWARQYDVGTHNLNTNRLPRRALEDPLYYAIEELVWLDKADAASANALERVLAEGHEIIWDFQFGGDVLSHPWKFTVPPAPMGEGHRMLLVGYDRRDPDNKYFIAKNSWGPTTNPGTAGFTYLEYDFVQYGEWASYIKKIKKPSPWPELKYIGRWQLDLADRQGVLDIYHLPGLMQHEFNHNQYRDRAGRDVRDQRLGTFYEFGDPAKAYHVNGNVSAGLIQLWIDFENPTRRWDELTGSRVELSFINQVEMTGLVYHPRLKPREAKATLSESQAVVEPPAPKPNVPADDMVPPRIRDEFRAAWEKEGGSTGPLGNPSGGIFEWSPGAWMQAFERGKITFSESYGLNVVIDQ